MEEEFLQNVAHEIKNPLTSIIGFSEFLEKDAKNTKIVQRIQKQSKKFFSIVENMITLTQQSDDKNFYEICIHDCVTDAVHQLEGAVRLKNIELEYKEYDEYKNLRVMENATLLTIACKNVLENAIQHSKVSNAVTLESFIRDFENKFYVILCITDRGEGIASVDKDKILIDFIEVMWASHGREVVLDLDLQLQNKYLSYMVVLYLLRIGKLREVLLYFPFQRWCKNTCVTILNFEGNYHAKKLEKRTSAVYKI